MRKSEVFFEGRAILSRCKCKGVKVARNGYSHHVNSDFRLPTFAEGIPAGPTLKRLGATKASIQPLHPYTLKTLIKSPILEKISSKCPNKPKRPWPR